MQITSKLWSRQQLAQLVWAKSRPLFCVSILCALLPAQSQAEIYRCTSQEGKLISADRVPPECRGQTVRVYSNSGTLKSEIAPPPSAAEKQKQQQLAEAQRQADLAREELMREERYLTTHFRSESEIVSAQKKALEIVEGKKKLVMEQLELVAGLVADLSKEINSNNGSDNGSDNRNNKRSDTRSDKESKNYQLLYQGRLDEMKRSIKKSQDQLSIYESEIERINREYQQLLTRYRTVVVNRQRG